MSYEHVKRQHFLRKSSSEQNKVLEWIVSKSICQIGCIYLLLLPLPLH